MSLETQRRMAASILKMGVNRIWIDPDSIEKVQSAITRNEVRKLIHEGHIKRRPEKGVSQARSRLKTRNARTKGQGSKKAAAGKSTAPWHKQIRALRSFLKEQKNKHLINPSSYTKLSLMAKGGGFRSTSHLKEHIRARGISKRR